MKKTIHNGYIANGEDRIKHYYTDDVDSFPPDITLIGTTTYGDFSWTAFFQEVARGEQRGFLYNIQIGDLFYETPEA